jgi:hypothetical protein
VSIAEIVRDHVEVAKLTKADACQRNGGPSDLSPMMIWVDGDDKTNVALVDAKGSTMEYMPKVLSLVAQQLPKYIIFVAESLAREATSREEVDSLLEDHKPGDFSRQHNELGPLSNLKELLAFNGIDLSTGEQAQGVAMFTYDDFGQPVFSDTEVVTVPEEHINDANVTMIFGQFYRFMQLMREQN